jgi:putative ABC transport system permease protein
MKLLRALFRGWTWTMALREARGSRRKLLLFSSSVVLGIAALVAINSLARTLEESVDVQAKVLLGADLVVSARDPFTVDDEKILATVPGESARETSFSSMLYFPGTQTSRLVQVRALSGNFPFYGSFETDPPNASGEFRPKGETLIDEAVLLQFGAKPGDAARIGTWETRVGGALKKVPGESLVFSTIAPRVYMPMEKLPETGLLKKTSLARFKVFYRLPPETDVKKLTEFLKEKSHGRLSTETVETRQQDLGRSIANLYTFLSLAGFVALVLGAIGLASAVQVYVSDKVGNAAVLRCVGAQVSDTFAIYVAQGIALGVIGAAAGSILGAAILQIFPMVLGGFLPIAVSPRISWRAVLDGFGVGAGVCAAFTLLPLLEIRSASPLRAIRAGFEPGASDGRERRLLFALILFVVYAFALTHSRKPAEGAGFATGLIVALGVLAAVAKMLSAGVKRLRFRGLPFVLRQGLANVHRPKNRTVLLLVTLGLGGFLLGTLHLSQHALLTEIGSLDRTNRANLVLFDIQSDQREAVKNVLKTNGYAVLDDAAFVTMRITSIKGESVEQLTKPGTRRGGPGWALRREYRSTFRGNLQDSEELVAGQWISRSNPTNGPVPVSVEEGIARDLQIGLNDPVVFDVQGVPVETRIASIRKVDWKRIQPNFFFVFPEGVLEEAPGFFIVTTRANSPEESSRLQNEAARLFPNVSIVDLRLILQTVDSVVSKVAWVVRFMALFTLATGLIVFVSSIVTTRNQRIRDAALLRVLGASRGQVLSIEAAEFALIGAFAALCGQGLALAAAWSLARWAFKVPFSANWTAVFVLTAGLALITTFLGLLASRGACSEAPLKTLREG